MPSGGGTGPIRATNAAGTRRSDQDFKFPRIEHRTTATLKLSEHLVATGQIRIPDGFTRCRVHRTVSIPRHGNDSDWPKVRKGEMRRDGSYRIKLPDREGRYRAFVKRMHLTMTSARPVTPTGRHTSTAPPVAAAEAEVALRSVYPTVCIPPAA